jgi:hypothetical protein
MRCTCLPEMKKDRSYIMRIVFNTTSNIELAVCGCVAGIGPTCTCKHLGALCYFLEEFCRLHSTSYESCTSSLQTWHQPTRKRAFSPCAASDIKFYKATYGREKVTTTTCNYDPRPLAYQGTSASEIETLQDLVKQLPTPVALSHVLPLYSETASTHVLHSSSCLPLIPRSYQMRVMSGLFKEIQPISLKQLYEHGMKFLKNDFSN